MKKGSLSIICLLFNLLSNFCDAQNASNFWYFGYQAGLDFNTSPPTVLTNGKTHSYECSAAMSDASGNLLFYTQGDTVWDKNHNIMPNGTGIIGNTSSTQCLIIKKPGSVSTYYIFTSSPTEESGVNGYRYTEVDMTLNGGLGDVTSNKNILLYAPSSERITAVKHCNGTDIWVITQPSNQNGIKSFLVSSAGVNTTAVVSGTAIVTSSVQAYVGQLKASSDGKKIGLLKFNNSINVYNFDNYTGTVTSLLTSITSGVRYSFEFSPDSKKIFYCAGVALRVRTLCTPITTSLLFNLSGKTPIATLYSMQLAPDGNIYIMNGNSGDRDTLSVLQNPNSPTPTLSYKSIYLLGKNSGSPSGFSLPNFFIDDIIPYQAPTYSVSIPTNTTISCQDYSFSPPSVTGTDVCLQTYSVPITSIQWDFGDPASGASNTSSLSAPSHTFSAPGTYTVQHTINYLCHSYSSSQIISACSILPIELLSFTTECNSSGTTINWSTSTETNNNHFTLSKSSNAINWIEIAKINSHGNSSSINQYVYVDNFDEDQTSDIWYYQLSQIDNDGSQKKFPVLSSTCNTQKQKIIILYPNPASNDAFLKIVGYRNQSISISIQTSTGSNVFFDTVLVSHQALEYPLNLSDLSNGMYFVNITSQNKHNRFKLCKQ